MGNAMKQAEASETYEADSAAPDEVALSEHYQRALQALRDVRHMLPPNGVDLVDKILNEVTLEAQETGGQSLLALLDYEQDAEGGESLLVTHDHIYGNWRGI
jgi:hypothetical protein